MLANIRMVQTTWLESEKDLRAIRTSVFIQEQAVAPEFEWDTIDKTAVHLLVIHQNAPIACLRIIDYHKIGRMAVLKAYRRHGLGAALLLEAVKLCKVHGSRTVYLSAQTHAIGFYERSGFKVTSEIYQDLHIPHVDMQLELSY